MLDDVSLIFHTPQGQMVIVPGNSPSDELAFSRQSINGFRRPTAANQGMQATAASGG